MSERLTDEDLGRALIAVRQQAPPLGMLAEYVERLIAEVRRLRSDSWLERAAEEISRSSEVAEVLGINPVVALAILKRHRDQA